MKILILCSDNSCLSQMAQGWLQSFDKSLTVCSAGISPAIEVHPLAVQTLASSGIDISHHKPEAVEEYIDYYANKRIQTKTKWRPPVQYRLASTCSA